jgi:PGF-CTERM protein
LFGKISPADIPYQIATFTFTSMPIAETLIDLDNSGVKIKGIYEKRQNSTWCTYKLLHDAGIEVIWDGNPKTVHHKFFIIDNTTTITGSYNPSKHANTANDEKIIVVHNSNIANAYADEFFKMWNGWDTPTPETTLKSVFMPSPSLVYTPSPSPTLSPTTTPMPGFELLFAIIGVVAAICLIKRKG